MKLWCVDYSVRCSAGVVDEYVIVDADDIHRALAVAEEKIKNRPGEDVVFWNVGIMADDVFEQEARP